MTTSTSVARELLPAGILSAASAMSGSLTLISLELTGVTSPAPKVSPELATLNLISAFPPVGTTNPEPWIVTRSPPTIEPSWVPVCSSLTDCTSGTTASKRLEAPFSFVLTSSPSASVMLTTTFNVSALSPSGTSFSNDERFGVLSSINESLSGSTATVFTRSEPT